MTTFDRMMALYWCLLPVQLAFTWLDVSRQRAPRGTWRRVVAARRQLWLAPGSAAAYTVGLASAMALVGLLHRLDQAERVLGTACSVALLLSAWHDARRVVDAWHDSGYDGWWRRLRRRLHGSAARPMPRPAFVA
jgi:hypothetical protein